MPLLSVLLLSAAAVAAAPGPGRALVRRDTELRAQPGAGAATGKVSAGAAVDLLERGEQACRVEPPRGKPGWVDCDALDLGDPSQLRVVADSPFFAERGAQYQPDPPDHPVAGRLPAGAAVRRVRVHGAWYLVATPEGREVWMHASSLAPSPAERVRAFGAAVLLAEPPAPAGSKARPPARAGEPPPQVRAGERVVELARQGLWSRVRKADGRTGWLRLSALVHDDGLPAGATSETWYRLFERLDRLGAPALPVQWWLLLQLPSLLLFLAWYRGVGRLRLVSNRLLKLGFALVGFLAVFTLATRFFPGVPPYMTGPGENAMTLLSLVYLAIMVYVGWRHTDRDRCDRCRRVRAGVGLDTTLAGDRTETTTTTRYLESRTGAREQVSREVRERNVKTYCKSMRCRFCGHTWTVTESVSSTRGR